jgi:hypothetical protein
MADRQDERAGDPARGITGAGLLDEHGREPLDGTGGSSGGGTIGGSGPGADDISGGTAGAAAHPGTPAATTGSIASDAAALGSADGSLADAARRSTPRNALTGAEAVGSGAGRGEVGSGTPADTGELGGGGGGTGPAGTARPGGDSRA